jgi:hypothetical protein
MRRRQLVQFVILLPRSFNDGRPVPPELFLETYEELIAQFGGATIDTVDVTGYWELAGVRYADQLRRIIVVGEDNELNRRFMRELKERLLARFDQLEIWIEVYKISLI